MKVNYTIEDLNVDLVAELRVENNGIGGYEYAGCKGYDSGKDYLVLDGLMWDKFAHDTEQNYSIEKYIEEHWNDIEKDIIKQINIKYDIY